MFILLESWSKSPVPSVETLQAPSAAIQLNSAAKLPHKSRTSETKQDWINGKWLCVLFVVHSCGLPDPGSALDNTEFLFSDLSACQPLFQLVSSSSLTESQLSFILSSFASLRGHLPFQIRDRWQEREFPENCPGPPWWHLLPVQLGVAKHLSD